MYEYLIVYCLGLLTPTILERFVLPKLHEYLEEYLDKDKSRHNRRERDNKHKET